jgi:hypothetical protein
MAVAVAGAPALAKDKHRKGKSLDMHNSEVQSSKYRGWQQTANGTWVQPVGDPRYPGASPSGGRAIMTKDDMDADAFKPSALINPHADEVEGGRITVRYEQNDTGLVDENTYVEPADRSGPYVDNGSVYSQEPSTPR